MSGLDFLSREDVLGGLPAKRAASIFFLIETRTAKLVAQARTAMSRYITDEALEQRELEYLEAYATGKEPPRKPTIQDLERYATQWSDIVPDNPRVQAALAHMLSQKYKFTAMTVMNLRAALGLDDERVGQAYKSLYGKGIEEIYAQQMSVGERLQWTWTAISKWLESLPPFWTAYSLTVTETVGMSILAIPIAIAHIGPLAGIAVIVILGLVNILTVAAMAESVARSGQARYGNAYFGRVIHEYLGNVGGLAVSIVMYVWGIIALLACYIGIGSVLADFTHIPVYVWVTIIFLADLYFVKDLAHDSLNSSVAFALVVGAVNVAVILILSALTLTQFNATNFFYLNVPFLTTPGFDPTLIEVMFGVILLAYLGHTAAGTCGKPVLNRDPSGRSLIWGSVAGIFTVMILYVLWVVAVNSAIDFETLGHQTGTVLHPLANALGPAVQVLGVIFAALGMGMLSVHASLGIFSLVDERIPHRSRPILLLPRRRARLTMTQRDAAGKELFIHLTYLGLERGQPYFRWDVQIGSDTFHLETPIPQRYETRLMNERIPALRRANIHFLIEIVDAKADTVRLRATTTMDLDVQGEWDVVGVSMADMLVLPEREAQTMNWLMRQGGATLAQIVEHTNQSERDARTMMNALAEQGFVRSIREEQETRYRAQMTPKRGRQLPDEVWKALEDATGAAHPEEVNAGGSRVKHWLREFILDERVRVVLTRITHVAVFVWACALFFTGQDSFVGVLSFGGVICATLAAGIFPVLVLYAARRKGELVPTPAYRVLGHPIFVGIVYFLFIATLVLHIALIWHNPLEQGLGVVTVIATLLTTYFILRSGEFDSRVVVEVRENLYTPTAGATVVRGKSKTDTDGIYSVVSRGRLTEARVDLDFADGKQEQHGALGTIKAFAKLRKIEFAIPPLRATQLKVRAHRLTYEIDSEPLPAHLRVTCNGETQEYDLELTRGQVVVTTGGRACRLELALAEPSQT